MEKTPVFVKIDEYKQLTKLLQGVDQKLNEANTLLSQLEQLKEQEDIQLKAWIASIEEVKARSQAINEALFRRDLK